MKKHLYTILFLICLTALTACGKGNNTSQSQQSKSEIYDIRVEERELFPAETQTPGLYYGVQFYGDEIVQVMEDIEEAADGNTAALLLKENGSSELLLPKYNFFTGRWFLTKNGQSILFYDEGYGGGIHVLSPEGQKLFSLTDVSGLSLCETEEGRIYLLALDRKEDSVFLAELNMTTGDLRRLEGLSLNRRDLNSLPPQCLGLGPEGLMLMNQQGIWQIEDGEDKASQSLWLSFESTTYMDMHADGMSNPSFCIRDVSGFRVLEDDSVEVLWDIRDSGKGLLQILKSEKVEKEILRLRCGQLSSWMLGCITQFNQTNESYHIVPEQPSLEDLDTMKDFQQRTDMEIGAGKGADLIVGQASYDFYALLKQGALEDLSPYLERSGINRADYFPAAFAQERGQEAIYGISTEVSLMDLWIRSEVLGTSEEQNIETILDALDRYPEKGSVCDCPPREILLFFLRGSEDFWEMVDYENKTCDFDTELFRKILNVAKRYSARSYMDSDPIIDYRSVYFLAFENEAELQARGKTDFGYLFDDGIFSPLSWHQVLSINANSPAKDACWEFITLLLQEENQRRLIGMNARLPMNRKVFTELQSYYFELCNRNPEEHYQLWNDICTEQDMAEQLELMENLHFYPLGTESVLEIIWDEAKDYFDDLKPADAIIENINNRVQLYLDENGL